MSNLATIEPIPGSSHPFRFQIEGAAREPAFLDLAPNHDYHLMASQITRPLDEVTFWIGNRIMVLPVNEQRFGYPNDPSGQKVQQLREVAAFNRWGIERDQPELQIVIGSPLSAVSAYSVGIGRYEPVVQCGWPYKFKNVVDPSTTPPTVIDQFAEGV